MKKKRGSFTYNKYRDEERKQTSISRITRNFMAAAVSAAMTISAGTAVPVYASTAVVGPAAEKQAMKEWYYFQEDTDRTMKLGQDRTIEKLY